MREIDIQHKIRAALNKDGRCRLVRNQIGYDEGRRIRYGLGNGSPDLIGCLRDGRVFAIEVKSERGRQTPEQRSWWAAARAWGVTGGEARSVAEALYLLDQACR